MFNVNKVRWLRERVKTDLSVRLQQRRDVLLAVSPQATLHRPQHVPPHPRLPVLEVPQHRLQDAELREGRVGMLIPYPPYSFSLLFIVYSFFSHFLFLLGGRRSDPSHLPRECEEFVKPGLDCETWIESKFRSIECVKRYWIDFLIRLLQKPQP